MTQHEAHSESGCPPPQVRNTDLGPSERKLLELAFRLRFGTLLRVPINNGVVVLDPRPKWRRKLRLGKPDAGRSTKPLPTEFSLRAQQVELLDSIRGVKRGIADIEIQDGLPVDLLVEEDSGG